MKRTCQSKIVRLLVKQYPDYTARVVSDEGRIGRGHLDRFMELETLTPTIVTTSQMLTTGIDAQTCKNIVLVRVVTSMTEFKQIIGRGTRVRDDYGKLYFNILDYTGSGVVGSIGTENRLKGDHPTARPQDLSDFEGVGALRASRPQAG